MSFICSLPPSLPPALVTNFYTNSLSVNDLLKNLLTLTFPETNVCLHCTTEDIRAELKTTTNHHAAVTFYVFKCRLRTHTEKFLNGQFMLCILLTSDEY